MHADIEHILGNKTDINEKIYGPFSMEIPKLSKPMVADIDIRRIIDGKTYTNLTKNTPT